mmetsp:Transcript_93067/g.263383  ORF Transcript_93067/g.263383 Transcript_93067/m.263383 type:complete len:296 (+) Transcript_93067:452-1339(+)
MPDRRPADHLRGAPGRRRADRCLSHEIWERAAPQGRQGGPALERGPSRGHGRRAEGGRTPGGLHPGRRHAHRGIGAAEAGQLHRPRHPPRVQRPRAVHQGRVAHPGPGPRGRRLQRLRGRARGPRQSCPDLRGLEDAVRGGLQRDGDAAGAREGEGGVPAPARRRPQGLRGRALQGRRRVPAAPAGVDGRGGRRGRLRRGVPLPHDGGAGRAVGLRGDRAHQRSRLAPHGRHRHGGRRDGGGVPAARGLGRRLPQRLDALRGRLPLRLRRRGRHLHKQGPCPRPRRSRGPRDPQV